MAKPRAVIDIVRAETLADQLLEKIGLFVRGFGRAEARDRLGAMSGVVVLQSLRRERQRLLPRRLAEHSAPVGTVEVHLGVYFADKGGLVGAADDAGFIYTLYGFTYLSELELLQEAGFHPIDVIQCATGNNAKIMGLENQLGRVRQGFLADLILIDENPLANLKYLYPTGVLDIKDGKDVIRGGIKWTIKDGIVYNTPTLMREVKDMVSKARAERNK
jgi:hypothetical protein